MLLLCCYQVGVTLWQELLGNYSHAVTCLWVHGPSSCMVFNLSAWKHMNVSDIESCCCSEIPSRSHGIWTGVCWFVFVDLRTVFAALVVTVCWSLYAGLGRRREWEFDSHQYGSGVDPGLWGNSRWLTWVWHWDWCGTDIDVALTQMCS